MLSKTFLTAFTMSFPLNSPESPAQHIKSVINVGDERFLLVTVPGPLVFRKSRISSLASSALSFVAAVTIKSSAYRTRFYLVGVLRKPIVHFAQPVGMEPVGEQLCIPSSAISRQNRRDNAALGRTCLCGKQLTLKYKAGFQELLPKLTCPWGCWSISH